MDQNPMVHFNLAHHVLAGAVAVFGRLGSRQTARKPWKSFVVLRRKPTSVEADWRTWLLFWVVFLTGCTMAAAVA